MGGWFEQLCLAILSTSPLSIIISFNQNFEFSVIFSDSICLYLFVAGFACHHHSGSFEVMLAMGMLWIAPIPTVVAVYFSNDD
jgi:hypothetical protein